MPDEIQINAMIDDLIDKFEEKFCRCEWIPSSKVEQGEMDYLQLILTARIWKLLNSPVSTPKVSS